MSQNDLSQKHICEFGYVIIILVKMEVVEAAGYISVENKVCVDGSRYDFASRPEIARLLESIILHPFIANNGAPDPMSYSSKT